jgi:hypothetical protein
MQQSVSPISIEAREHARLYWRQNNAIRRALKMGLPVEPRKRGRPRKAVQAVTVMPAPAPLTRWLTGEAGVAALALLAKK